MFVCTDYRLLYSVYVLCNKIEAVNTTAQYMVNDSNKDNTTHNVVKERPIKSIDNFISIFK